MRRKLTFIDVVIVVILGVLAFSTSQHAASEDGLLHVYFLDVGQGDAQLIEIGGNQILIDGGPDSSILTQLGRILPPDDHELDFILATHPHSDHIYGLTQVLKRYNVDYIVQAHETYDSEQFRSWQKSVDESKAQNIEALAGQVFDLGNGATLTILHPFTSAKNINAKGDDAHDHVVVAMLQYKKLKLLFTGDMEKDVELKLINSLTDISADVLKVGHHGSKTSSSTEFLTAVRSQVGFIEVGANNRYRLPAPEILNRLANFGILYYRTDLEGTSELISDGENFQIINRGQ